MLEKLAQLNCPKTRPAIRAVAWVLLLAIMLVQLNGHMHRVAHTDLSHGESSWFNSSQVVSDQDASGKHNCFLLDALSLGMGPTAHLDHSASRIKPANLIRLPYQTADYPHCDVVLPPLRGPPMFA